jgi:hypothetical protein
MDDLQLKRAPGTCCPEPSCDNWTCMVCEYLGKCKDDANRTSYCPRPWTCAGCGANCLECSRWNGPVFFEWNDPCPYGQSMCDECGEICPYRGLFTPDRVSKLKEEP